MTPGKEAVPPAVVVGVDGSRAAVRAALWAVDEAVHRGTTLRLVHACDPADALASEGTAQQYATADIAVHQVITAIRATGKAVEVVAEIIVGNPVAVLRRASESAAMVCVGPLGLRHFANGHLGSTATSLALSAHCPVAVIRGRDNVLSETGWILAEVDESADSDTVVALGVAEALLRHAPLRVIASRGSTTAGGHRKSEEHQLICARLERKLDRWRRRYPELDATTAAVHGPYLDYLNHNADNIQLVITSAHNQSGVKELFGANGHATLNDSASSVLVVNHRRM